MVDLEFFFDPMCPFAWITSRWVDEVRRRRDYDVAWRFIALAIVNEGRDPGNYSEQMRSSHRNGMKALRVADAVRQVAGNEGVGAYYTAMGTALHTNGRRAEYTEDPQAFIREALTTAGLAPALADAADDDSHDEYLRSETETALDRAGKDLGTPILTFAPGTDREASFFGPVVSRIPRGDEALRLWDAVEVLATTPDVAELKRARRSQLVFD
jgi:2-hydroxychromene-2-carboxylate isomerase